MGITTLIAEDEPRTRSALQEFCRKRAELNLVAQVKSGAQTVSAIESVHPELLLLDSQLPDMSAAEVLSTARTPREAFTVLLASRRQTAGAGIAPKGVLHYLFKPIERAQFDDVIDVAVARRAEATLEREPPDLALAPQPLHTHDVSTHDSVLLIGERGRRFHFLESRQVDYIEVEGNYVTLHVAGERFIARATLKRLSDMLAARDFVRIDRSRLVNLHRVDYAERMESGQFCFRMLEGFELVSSRERASDIARMLRAAVR